MLFNKQEAETLKHIINARRDIRGNNFIDKKVSKKVLKQILSSAVNAPSVGYSQPWRFKLVQTDKTKNKIHNIFKKSFKKSQKSFKNKALYKSLKLEGIKESDLNIAIFYKKPKKTILGQTSMKRMGEYSVVCAIQNMWLTARALNVGIGWVSIIKPKKIKKILDVGNEYKLVGYLCVGYTKEFLKEPELKTIGWERKKNIKKVMI